MSSERTHDARRLDYLYSLDGDVGGGWLSTAVRRARINHVRLHGDRRPHDAAQDAAQDAAHYQPQVSHYSWTIEREPGQLTRHIPTPLHPAASPIPPLLIAEHQPTPPPWLQPTTQQPRLRRPFIPRPQQTHLAEDPNRQPIQLTAGDVGQRPLGPTPECRVCLAALADIVFQPCHHVVCCGTCTVALQQQRCPICRQDVTEAFRIFF